VSPHRLIETFELESAGVNEAERLAQLGHRSGNESLAWLCLGAEARGELNGRAEEISFALHGLTSRRSDPHADRLTRFEGLV
jgi:hypothetical protein